jgi:alpha-L-rhamnosidase
MCYPADHFDGVFIPNWALWFVVQLEEYLKRSGDRETVEALRERVLDLFEYFEPFRNEKGLLEKLESWVFVEWSKANQFVQDVNFPSNMLYAGALAAAGRIYGLDALLDQAEQVRAVVRELAFDGVFFVDNALRREGGLEVTAHRTEVCQYFAFFFEVAHPKSHPELWKILCESFGPHRQEKGLYPEVHPANAFVGNMLRFEVLSRYGQCGQILDESVDYLLYMAKETGTLWENTGSYASCNHGFASHIVHTLFRDVLGLYEVDRVKKRIQLRFSDHSLAWCEGRLPGPDGFVTLWWQREGKVLSYQLERPAGYSVSVEVMGGLEVREMR